MKTLILDNYDSFTWNLYQYIAELGGAPEVHRNDKISIEDVRDGNYSHIIIGPGPGNPNTPRDIGISESLIDEAAENHIPLLGVCLGHQILVTHFGGKVGRSPEAVHGRASRVRITSKSCIFDHLPSEIEAMRYHSLCGGHELPSVLTETAVAEDDGVLMALEHQSLPLFGVQFHPESIGTPMGKDILRNFLAVQ